MPIALDHLIVPARDRKAAAALVAKILGVRWAEQAKVGPFSPVFVSDTLTLDFDQVDGAPTLGHYAFHVSDAELDAIVARLEASGIAYRSGPFGPPDNTVGSYGGGRLVYWSEPDGHAWEALTKSYARE